MLRSQINVDLPSEERERQKTLVEWLRQSIGKSRDLRTGREELSISGLEIVEAIMVCFYRCKVRNMLSLVVDSDRVFVDNAAADDDAEAFREAVKAHPATQSKFGTMHLVAEHNYEGLHVVIRVVVRSEVSLGEKEMQITLSARPSALRYQPGESPKAYADRLIEYARSSELEEAIIHLNRFTSELGREFQVQVGMYSVSQGPAQAVLVRPEPEVVWGFEKLDFSSVSEPKYQPVATTPHPDAYYQHFRDPLYDFQNFILLAEVVESHVWALSELVMVESKGQVLATGDDLDDEGDAVEWQKFPRLRFDESAKPTLSAAPAEETPQVQ